ncbi:MAG: hypothetical protein H0T62_12395 [Parachlamydiaceae bacterium]|nr:hypothetical protein [Parachlamydiaceae bacterium]
MLQLKSNSCYRSVGLSSIGRGYSLDNQHLGYHELQQSSDRDKVTRIAKTFFLESQIKYLLSGDEQVLRGDLIDLINRVEANFQIPIKHLGLQQQSNEAHHFEENRTFINLPYSPSVSKWSDRAALQLLIRDKFNLLFKTGDLVLIPGCADGQIPIEIHAHAMQQNVELDIVAVDFNTTAMKLGYCTMKSYGLDPDRIHWVQADATSASFFDWVSSTFASRLRHQIVTLIQPSMQEEKFISFLKRNADFACSTHHPSTVVMPILLEDHETLWYKIYEGIVNKALNKAKITCDLPELIWKKTKFGREALKLNSKQDAYVPQQYFILPESILEIQKITGYSEAAQKVFGSIPQSQAYHFPEDPRMINSKESKRMFCIWEVNNS